MLVDGWTAEEKQYVQDANGNYADVCQWEEVECKDDFAFNINLSDTQFTQKRFPFEYIPPLVVFFSACRANLHGTLDTAVLPKLLHVLYISENTLDGILKWKSLPQKLRQMSIHNNHFEGSLQLSDLPATLKGLMASMNYFVGKVCLNDLPPVMDLLDISSNSLSGPIHIERLPYSMEEIDLSSNHFSGEFRMLVNPEKLVVNIWSNSAIEHVVLAKASGPMRFLIKADFIESVVDETGKTHEWQEYIIEHQSKST